ncbi:CobW family GTP-binding protein [Dongia deserti]|uniref:CobW family GTP-binding protein n=1 Tax=Dongia deserti TaxID=2268030 RepID=UPI000E65E819|nr:GTP-binding protein [Dongia deserti]
MSEAEAPELERLPVSVITGFLGSGKTTLLKNLLLQPDMADTAVVINEFGEIGLDHLLVEEAKEDTILMSSGCLCCSIRGDLIDTLRRLYKRRERGEVPRFKRLVIETTGLADPAPILQTLIGDPLLSAFYRLDGVVTTVDAVNGMSQLDRQFESVKQAAVADRLVLTKIDLADADHRKALEARLRGLNPAASLLPVAHGAVAAEQLFNAGLYNPAEKSPDVSRWLKEEAYAEAQADHHNGHDHHDHGHANDVNRHDDHIRAFCLTYDRPIDWDKFVNWIEMLITMRGADLLRIKGILDVAGSDVPVAIHGIQHLFHPPAVLPGWTGEDRRSRIVFITRDLERTWLEQSMAEFLA